MGWTEGHVTLPPVQLNVSQRHSRRAPSLMMADMLLISLLQVLLIKVRLTDFAPSWQR